MLLRWRRVFRVIPVPVFVVDRDALPDGVGGDARWIGIRIRRDLWERGDVGIVEHELEHIRWFWVLWIVGTLINAPVAAYLAAQFGSPLTPVQAAIAVWVGCMLLHAGLYEYSRNYREIAEVAAYLEQMRHPDGKGGRLTLELAAVRLAAPRYKLGLDVAGAKVVLRTGVGNG